MTHIVMPNEADVIQQQLKTELIAIINNEKTFLKRVQYDWLDGPTSSITFEYVEID